MVHHSFANVICSIAGNCDSSVIAQGFADFFHRPSNFFE